MASATMPTMASASATTMPTTASATMPIMASTTTPTTANATITLPTSVNATMPTTASGTTTTTTALIMADASNVDATRAPSPSSSTITRSNSSNSGDLNQADYTKELIKLIPRYDGTGGIQKYLEYAGAVENLVLNSNISPTMQLNLATTKLIGDANMWWQRHLQTTIDSPNRITDWKTLRLKLREFFAPTEQAHAIRIKLRSLKQQGSVADYNAAFRILTLQLDDLGEAEEKFEYIRGLKPRIREMIQGNKDNLSDIQTLQIACLRVDNGTKSSEEANYITSNNRGRGSYQGSYRGTYRGSYRGSSNRDSSNSTSRGRGSYHNVNNTSRGRGKKYDANDNNRGRGSHYKTDRNNTSKGKCSCGSSNHQMNACPILKQMCETFTKTQTQL